MNYNLPDNKGKFGKYGGMYIPETLVLGLKELETAYLDLKDNRDFKKLYSGLLKEYVGRPTPLTYAKRLSEYHGKGEIYLKREDLCHTGAHKINNTLGQILLAKQIGKSRIIAETGAGQHGVATATVCAKFNMKCVVYMGETDVDRQSLNVYKMKLLGAEVITVKSGNRTLKDATNEAIRDWVGNIDSTHYIIGSVVGPHPYPMIVRDFQSVIGMETSEQVKNICGSDPSRILACVGGGSNAMGIFYPFIGKSDVQLYGIEAAGKGLDSGNHCASLSLGNNGIFHGMFTKIIQDKYGQINEVYSISAGLDYPGVGPEHCNLKDIERVVYGSVTDGEALEALQLLSELEGIIPALESSHALAYLNKLPEEIEGKDLITVINLSGRGDKDMPAIKKNIKLD